MQNHTKPILIAGFAVLLFTTTAPAGDIPVYQLASTPAPVVQAPTADTAPLTWQTPEGWSEAPPSSMRVASFKVNRGGQQADISVIPLGGVAGGDDANVNRWRGQLGLSEVTADELQKNAESVVIGGQPGALHDLAGATQRIVGAIQHRDDTAWFFKMAGDATLVEQEKPAFLQFLRSLKFAGAVTAPAGALGALPPGHPGIGDMGGAGAEPAAPISHDGQPAWTVPSDWREISGGQFLIAKFLLKGDEGAASVNVSQSTGDGGGLPANVNRWRGQLGLQPVAETLTSPVTVTGGAAVLVDLSGNNPQTGWPTRLVAVIVTQGDNTWFYKMMGDSKMVSAQKDAFIKFVQTTKY